MADYIGAVPPKRPFLNALARGLESVNAFASKPFGYDNPPGEMLVNALSLPAIARTLDSASYGYPLTRGKGMTTRLTPDAEEAATALAPVVAKWPKQAAGAAAGLLGMADTGAGKAMSPMIAATEDALRAAKLEGWTDSSGRTYLPSRLSARGSPEFRQPGGATAAQRWMEFSQDDRSSLNQATARISGLYRDRDTTIEASGALQSMAQTPQLPEWATRLTGGTPNQAAGAEWWARALSDKSRASVEAFAEASRANDGGLLFGPGSKSKNADEIASAFSGRGAQVKAEWAGETLRFKTANGHLDIMDAGSNPVIRSTGAGSKGKDGGSGKLLYQSAYQWLSNNGKLAAPDVGLSEINQIRKLGNELSAQVRNQAPSAVMNTDRLTGVQDVPSIWAAESAEVSKRIPDVSRVSFDGQSFKLGRKIVSDSDITALIAKVDPPFDLGVGPMTAKRAAIYRWLQKATPEQASAAAKLLAGGALAGGYGSVFADQSK